MIIQRFPTVVLAGLIIAVSISLFAYLMWYVSPDEVIERVRIVAITAEGCIVETPDGHAITIEYCNGQPDDYIDVPIDQNIKERAMLMNPTT